MDNNKRNAGNSVPIKIICVLLIAGGLLLIGLSLISALVSTAITFGMVMPALLGLLMILYAAVRLKKKGMVFRQRWFRRVIAVCLVAGLAAVAVLETLMNIAAYKEQPEKDVGFVIVLGCGVFPDGQLTLSLKNRLDTAYDYLVDHEDSLCIVSGGKGDYEPKPEAQAMRSYLLSRGIEDSRILVEDKSDSTLLNLTYSKEIMSQHSEQPKTVAVVTSDYHVFRAMLLAKELGLDAFGMPSGTNWRIVVACHVREYAAIMKTVIFGGEKP